MSETKRCPGIASIGLEAHEAPATLEHFSANKSLPDGLAVRCRNDDRLFGKLWNLAKKHGEKFSGKAGASVPAAVRAYLEESREPGASEARIALANEAGAFVADHPEYAHPQPELPAPKLVVSEGKPIPQYADELAMRAARGRAKGYQAETVGALIYALPVDSAVLGSPAGQAALAKVNEARTAERRRRDAERKREERAAAKAKREAAYLPTAATERAERA